MGTSAKRIYVVRSVYGDRFALRTAATRMGLLTVFTHDLNQRPTNDVLTGAAGKNKSPQARSSSAPSSSGRKRRPHIGLSISLLIVASSLTLSSGHNSGLYVLLRTSQEINCAKSRGEPARGGTSVDVRCRIKIGV